MQLAEEAKNIILYRIYGESDRFLDLCRIYDILFISEICEDPTVVEQHHEIVFGKAGTIYRILGVNNIINFSKDELRNYLVSNAINKKEIIDEINKIYTNDLNLIINNILSRFEFLINLSLSFEDQNLLILLLKVHAAIGDLYVSNYEPLNSIENKQNRQYL